MALCSNRRRKTLLRILIVLIPAAFFFACLTYMNAEDAKHRENFSYQYPQQIDRGQERVDFSQGRRDFQTEKFNSKQRRRNILVIAHGRSGSTITGDIFNHHPSVFYLFEPLQTVERIFKKLGTSDEHYGSLMADILSNLLRCNFSKPVLEDFDHFYRYPSHRQASHAIGSPPLCPYEMNDPKWDPKLCPPMTSESLGSICRDKYPVTVAKILMSRIAGNNIKNILEACKSSDADCQIIFLVRDPRAAIPSSQSVGFFSNRGSQLSKNGLRLYSYQKCKKTEENLVFLKNLPISRRRRIMIQRYEDFAMNPLKVLSRLYNFAGLPVLDSVKTWLNKSTHPEQTREKMKIEGHAAFFTVDDASVAVNRWRWKVDPCVIDIIEHYCEQVMQMMGYTLVDRSYDLMANISIPLFSEEYEAKKWFIN
ncbi:carbohydrate sulfotransferase 3-like [Orbicella faveolata]|uniref:carbohydrate sulfotransferase 3-like n=1 Tax=Orbicella faveolata TaxID=48498 RepID=UPI0009E3EA5B|nr:carbohydrate sulfotransferase 3-like [Orbicella faveolata]